MEACLLRPSPVHPLEQGVGQVLGDEVGDHQHVGLGKGGLFELGQGLLQAGHQIGPSVKTHGEKALRLLKPGVGGDLQGRHLGGEEHQIAAPLLLHRPFEQGEKQRLGALLRIAPHGT